MFLNQYIDNPNEPQNIPNKTKAALKKMAMEQELYARMVMIRLRDSDDKKENKKLRNITSKENQKYQDVGSILIMSG